MTNQNCIVLLLAVGLHNTEPWRFVRWGHAQIVLLLVASEGVKESFIEWALGMKTVTDRCVCTWFRTVTNSAGSLQSAALPVYSDTAHQGIF